MINIQELKKEIVERLKPLNPDKIILFGSYAYGEPNEDSDIDLYVVTNDNFLPKSWREKNNLYLKVSRLLRSLREKVAIDLIVHTKKMHELLSKQNSNFYKYDLKKGIILC